VSPCQENSFRSVSLQQPLSLARHGFCCSAKNKGLKRRSKEDKLLGIFLLTGNDRGLGVQHLPQAKGEKKEKAHTQRPRAACILWLPLQVTGVAVHLERGVLGSSLAREAIWYGCRDVGSLQAPVIRHLTALWVVAISVVIFVYLCVI